MRKTNVAGVLLFFMMVMSIAQHILEINLLWISGSIAWLAAILIAKRIGRGQRIQASILLGSGVAMMIFALSRGGTISIEQAIGQNQPILAMLAAVSFLRLIDRPVTTESIPIGKSAFFKTLFGLNLLSAAINITALIVVCDRLARQSPFTRLHGLMLGRAFGLTVMYSPFIGGMALTLALLPEASLSRLAMFGIPYVLCGLIINAGLLYLADKKMMRQFMGYPLRFDSLVFPVVLVIIVLIIHRVLPDFSVLALIALCAPILTLVTVAYKETGARAISNAGQHIVNTLPTMAGELWLFLAAGVFAAGITSLASSFNDWTLFSSFDVWAACITFAFILLFGVIGIHPIVCVSFLAAVLVPQQPPQLLLAFVFIMGWAIGCMLSPFSGTNLIIQGRYGINNWSLTSGNLLYGSIMFVVGCGFLYLIDALLIYNKL